MLRRTAATGTMIDRIGRAIAAADNGDFEADKARYRGLASVALKPLTRPCEAMVDAAYQAVSFDGYRAINSRSDVKKAKGDDYLRHAGIREVDERDVFDRRLGQAAGSETAHPRWQRIDPAVVSVGWGAVRETRELRCCAPQAASGQMLTFLDVKVGTAGGGDIGNVVYKGLVVFAGQQESPAVAIKGGRPRWRWAKLWQLNLA
jgi:hypothetical protein